jgi:hypothetical protein
MNDRSSSSHVYSSKSAWRLHRSKMEVSTSGFRKNPEGQAPMSALPPKADIAERNRHVDPVRRKVGHTTAPG